MKRVLFVATLVRGHIAKFHIPYLKMFKESGWETWVAAKNDYPDGCCSIPYCDYFINIDFARSPFSGSTVVAYRQLAEVFKKHHFDLVHAHTPVGGVLARLAARNFRQTGTKVVYTAHGFHFYKGAPIANWLLWGTVELAMSKLTDLLITINQEDYGWAKKHAMCKVVYCPGVGVDLSRFSPLPDSVSTNARELIPEEVLQIRTKGYTAVACVGDFTKNKNQQFALNLISKREDLCLLLLGDGVEKDNLVRMASDLKISDRVFFLGFRDDVERYLRASDVLLFPTQREGMPMSSLEALACGVPVVGNDVRGLRDQIVNGHNGYIYDGSLADCEKKINAVMNLSESEGLHLRHNCVISARKYGITEVAERMACIYEMAIHDFRSECDSIIAVS